MAGHGYGPPIHALDGLGSHAGSAPGTSTSDKRATHTAYLLKAGPPPADDPISRPSHTLPRWAAQTRTGDLSENAGWERARRHGLGVKLTSTGEECLGRACPCSRQCFLRQARARAQEVQQALDACPDWPYDEQAERLVRIALYKSLLDDVGRDPARLKAVVEHLLHMHRTVNE